MISLSLGSLRLLDRGSWKLLRPWRLWTDMDSDWVWWRDALTLTVLSVTELLIKELRNKEATGSPKSQALAHPCSEPVLRNRVLPVCSCCLWGACVWGKGKVLRASAESLRCLVWRSLRYKQHPLQELRRQQVPPWGLSERLLEQESSGRTLFLNTGYEQGQAKPWDSGCLSTPAGLPLGVTLPELPSSRAGLETRGDQGSSLTPRPLISSFYAPWKSSP